MAQNTIPLAQIEVLNKIHHVDGFDPAVFAVEYTDLGNGESRKRLPVMVQIAWFRLKYPEGKIAITVKQMQDCFVATARVYPSYKDPEECYLAEATASREPDPEKPSVSPREWAQTAAVGVALRNAGFGVQFNAAGDEFPMQAPNEFSLDTGISQTGFDSGTPSGTELPFREPSVQVPSQKPATHELTPEQQYQADLMVKCTDTKFRGMTLGDILQRDPNVINWLVRREGGDPSVRAAAKRICEYALQVAAE